MIIDSHESKLRGSFELDPVASPHQIEIWSDIGNDENLPILITGIDSLPSFSFNHPKSDEIITFFTQEMLKEGFLAHGSCYMMTAHSDKIIKKYKKACENVFKKI